MTLDLWTPTVDSSRLHDNFRVISSAPYATVRSVIDSWASGFTDRDGNFVKEFQTKFNQQFWELYMNAVFHELKFSVDYSFDRPDYLLSNGRDELVAEATTTQAAAGIAPEWDRELAKDIHHADFHVLLQYATIRFSNAFSSKARKLRQEYLALPHVQEKPFLLCIGQYEQPLFFLMGHVPALRTLFGYDEPLHVCLPEGIRLIGDARRREEWKRSDASIPLAVFEDPANKDVSAVLCSALATTSKAEAVARIKAANLYFRAIRQTEHEIIHIFEPADAYQENIVDGLHLFVNPNAERPLPLAEFRHEGITIWHLENGQVRLETSAPMLTTRMTTRLLVRGEGKPTGVDVASRGKLPRPQIPEWNDDSLYKLEAETPVSDEEYLAHYHGWTIHIGRDRVDNDYFGHAVQGLYNSLHGVMDSLRKNKPTTPFVIDFDTKEAAHARVKLDIDEAMRSE